MDHTPSKYKQPIVTRFARTNLPSLLYRKMVSLLSLMQRRLLCSKASQHHHRKRQWNVKQVTKSNFADSLGEIKSHISSSDFLAVSLHNTGSFSSPWQRVSAFDTPDTAYFKAKYAAQRFQILQFAVCPFSVNASKITAHPYNFHLFPRDEAKLGMPSYSFMCQTASLAAMAREGFDFNTCVHNGISYLSKAQESVARVSLGTPIPANVAKSASTPSVADAVFTQKVKSRVKNWRNACKEPNTKKDEALVKALRKLALGSEEYQSRPSITIDVCSERQMQLVVEMVQDCNDDLVPLLVPSKGGGTLAVRVVLTSSKEDKDLLQRTLENLEEEQNEKVRGFREVIDFISSSRKPVVSHNSLNDLAFIHSKFVAPLPTSMDEFMHSLHQTFPEVIDVNQLMKALSPLKKVANIPVALAHLQNRFFAPIDVEVPPQAVASKGKIHGQDVVRICQLFVKLCHILKVAPIAVQSDDENQATTLEAYTNIFSSFSADPTEVSDGDIRIWTNNNTKVSCEDVVFLWGLRGGMTAGMLKNLLRDSHKVFSDDFDVRFVEENCAILVFWQPGSSRTFLDFMNCAESSGPLREMVSEGVRAAGYQTYSRACKLGLWEAKLADSLDKTMAETELHSEYDTKTKSLESYWCSESMINLDDL